MLVGFSRASPWSAPGSGTDGAAKGTDVGIGRAIVIRPISAGTRQIDQKPGRECHIAYPDPGDGTSEDAGLDFVAKKRSLVRTGNPAWALNPPHSKSTHVTFFYIVAILGFVITFTIFGIRFGTEMCFPSVRFVRSRHLLY